MREVLVTVTAAL